jgi:flagellar hook protein FlgE
MINSIFLAHSGMTAHERGLDVISQNIANMNTPGFRGSRVTFADVFIGSAPDNGVGQRPGGGVDAARSEIDFRSGDPQQTGGDLDVFLNGAGFFVVQDEDGQLRFTRAGRFDFNADGELVVRDQKQKVMARTTSGALVPITLGDLRTSAAKPTTQVDLDGILSSGDANGEAVIEQVTVFDSRGGRHTLRLVFTRDNSGPTTSVSARWNMKFSEGSAEVGTGTVEFFAGDVVEGSNPVRITLTLGEAGATEVAFNFDTVDGGPFGDNTNISVKQQDGFGPGVLATRTFDEKGVLKLTYTNGQTADGATLALARIADQTQLVQLGNSLFDHRGSDPVEFTTANDDVRVLKGAIEGANVSLTSQFTALILMQRGFQAGSQVLSTANEMLQQLFDLRGRR